MIASASSSPFIPGICISSIAASNEDDVSFRPRSSSSAAAPSSTDCGSAPQYASCAFSISLLVTLSSTISIFLSTRESFRRQTNSIPFGSFSSSAVNQNVEPLPSSLSTPISPPINCTSFEDMASPRPVPPNWRVEVPSACSNDSKIVLSAVSGIPTPVSITSKRTFSVTPSSCDETTS